MTMFATILLAVLSVWDYPARHLTHTQLRAQFIESIRQGDTETMAETCEKAVKLLPDDPTWAYNRACALAYFKDQEAALDALENAIDLGFRDADAIKNDRDLKRLEKNPRFKELIEYAQDMAGKPLLFGPNAVVPATGVFGRTVAIGAQNLQWNFDLGCFDVKMNLVAASSGGNTGDLYMNRDGGHSMLTVTNWPGLTPVRLDSEGRQRGADLDFPNMNFPYPVFGNCSRALTAGPYWRSLPRALMTSESYRISTMAKFYLSNQFWVFPAVDDYNMTTNGHGDVFMSVTPYWIATKGRSYSDQYYLRAALEASKSFHPNVKHELVSKGLLAPTIQAIIRKSLRSVKSPEEYLSPKAHPTCFPPSALDMDRLKKIASSMKTAQIPPVATIAMVAPENVEYSGSLPELTYATPCAWAFVLRAAKPERNFIIKARGGEEYEFALVHDELEAGRLERLSADAVKVTIDKTKLSPTNRVDMAVFAKNAKSDWGAPAYVSFGAVDPKAPYSDPVLTVLDQPDRE